MPNHRTRQAPSSTRCWPPAATATACRAAFYHDEALYAAEMRDDLAWRLAVRRIRDRDSATRRFPDADSRRLAGTRDPRRPGRRARVPQRVPPSRHATVPQGVRARARDRLPVSQLDVFAAGRARRMRRHARWRRQAATRFEARARRSDRRPDLRVARPPCRRTFDGLRERFGATAKPQGFDRARIAKVIEYEVEANWKLVWENNRECFHCVPCHPQYVKANFDAYEEAFASEAMRQKMAAAIARTEAEMGGAGHRDHACEGRPGAVSRSGPQHVVRRRPHGDGRRLRHRVDGRPARRAADGRLSAMPTSVCCGCAACPISGCTEAATTRSPRACCPRVRARRCVRAYWLVDQ